MILMSVMMTSLPIVSLWSPGLSPLLFSLVDALVTLSTCTARLSRVR